ncbi:MAG: hypothetical protein ACJAUL_002710, partial [Paraglaciecola sp.]
DYKLFAIKLERIKRINKTPTLIELPRRAHEKLIWLSC